MQVTKEKLLEHRKALEAQRAQAANAVSQATGALAMVDALLAQLDKPEPEVADGEGLRLVEQ